jgi:hypothetical protein
MSDYNINNLTGRPQVVGSGISLGMFMAQAQLVGGINSSGFNYKMASGMFDYYHDLDFPTGISGGGGANNFGIFEPGSVQLVQYLQYTGFQAGEKPGGSTFFVLPLPMLDPTNNMIKPVKFDCQIKYSDCTQTVTDSYTNQSVTIYKGYNVFLQKQFGLWQVYSDSYRAEDASYGINGSLLYNATNS